MTKGELTSLITRLEEEYGKVTNGRWFYDGMGYIFTEEKDGNNQMVADDGITGDGDNVRMRGAGAGLSLRDNATFIADAHNSMPTLLAALRHYMAVAEAGDAVVKFVQPMVAHTGTCKVGNRFCKHSQLAELIAAYQALDTPSN